MFRGVPTQVSGGDLAQGISGRLSGIGIVPKSIAGSETVPQIGEETVPEIGGGLIPGKGGMSVIGADLVPWKNVGGPVPDHIPEVVEFIGHIQETEGRVQGTGKAQIDQAGDGVIPERGGDKLPLNPTTTIITVC